MRSRSEDILTEAPKPHYQPHLPHSLADYFHVKMWNVRSPENQVAADLMDKYRDLIIYEPYVGQLVSRLPMMLRLSDDLTPPARVGLSIAVSSWNEACQFYSGVIPSIERKVSRNSKLFDATNVELYKAACLTLLEYKESVKRGHDCLMMTIKGLYQGGFTYSAIMPINERIYYRFSA